MLLLGLNFKLFFFLVHPIEISELKHIFTWDNNLAPKVSSLFQQQACFVPQKTNWKQQRPYILLCLMSTWLHLAVRGINSKNATVFLWYCISDQTVLLWISLCRASQFLSLGQIGLKRQHATVVTVLGCAKWGTSPGIKKCQKLICFLGNLVTYFQKSLGPQASVKAGKSKKASKAQGISVQGRYFDVCMKMLLDSMLNFWARCWVLVCTWKACVRDWAE